MKKLLSIMLVLTMALTLARRLRRLRLVFGAGGKLRACKRFCFCSCGR